MIGPAPICLDCVHYMPSDDYDEPMKCRAFPDGIPFEIIIGDFDHHFPHPNDGGDYFCRITI